MPHPHAGLSSSLTVQDGPLIVNLCMFQVGVFNGGVVVRHKDLLEKLDGEGALAYTPISHHHQLVRGEVVAGDCTRCHVAGWSDLGRQDMWNEAGGFFLFDLGENIHRVSFFLLLKMKTCKRKVPTLIPHPETVTVKMTYSIIC